MKKLIIIFIGIFLLLNAVSFASTHPDKKEEFASEEGEKAEGKGLKAEEGSHGSENSEHGSHEKSVAGHKEEVKGFITPGIDRSSYLPILCILVSLIGAFLVLATGDKEKARYCVTVITCGISFILLLLMWGPVIKGILKDGELYRGIYCNIEYFYRFNLSFRVDPAGLLVALITNFLWLLSAVYAIGYMSHEHKRMRYDFFMLMSLAMNLGALLAGDFLTLFIFFEGMLIFPYGLIIHEENDKAIYGANIFLYFGLVTGLALLAGIFLLYQCTGNINIEPMAGQLENLGVLKYVIAGLLIVGFGGKAGIFFEHIWLPEAHPVAPTPASALLSGAMIKVGAYGIFRTINVLYSPKSGEITNWLTMSNIGYMMIVIGAITMFLGVLSALISSNSKRMLAFHSISQMGYIVMGIGCAAYMGKDGAMGLAGALYHIFNHSLFKASLFLGVGAVYFRTNELDMYKLGGLWKNMPVSAICLLIAVCGISGLPGFNGFASKTLLHHSIIEAYEYSGHHFGKPDNFLRITEIIFILTAAGTFASNIKLFLLTFLGKRDDKYKEVTEVPWTMRISLIGFSAVIIFIGIFPNWLLEHIIGPALSYFNYDSASHAYHILYNVHTDKIHSTIPILYEPISLALNNLVVKNLHSSGTAILLGGVYFILGIRFGWFHIHVPEYLTVEFYYKNVFNNFVGFCTGPMVFIGEFVNKSVNYLFMEFWVPVTDWAWWEKSVVHKTGEGAGKPANSRGLVNNFDQAYDNKLGGLIQNKKPWELFDKMDKFYDKEITKLGDISNQEPWELFNKMDTLYDKEITKLGNIPKRMDMFETIEEYYSKRLDKIISVKKHWDLFRKMDGSYEKSLDKGIFNILGLEELKLRSSDLEKEKIPGEKIAPWFMKLTHKISLVHTGDIGTYITWIIFTLSLFITILIGALYIRSFQLMFIFIPLFIVIIIGIALFLK